MNESEKRVITKMIHIYCKGKHKSFKSLCFECAELLKYATNRLEHCRFKNDKPPCGSCSVHCYRSDMRQNMIQVMRFSGPKMLFMHPIDTVKHFYKQIQAKKMDCKESAAS